MAAYEEPDGPLLGGGVFEVHSHTDKYGFNSSTQIPAWFDVRVFYVRVSSCQSGEAPEQLRIRYPPRSIHTALEVNGARIAPSEEAVITLRRDRVDPDSFEVTYVSTAKFRTSGIISFEICHKRESVLRGCLERSLPTVDPVSTYDSNTSTSTLARSVKLGWNMECTCAVGSQGCIFLKGRHDLLTGSPSSMEVCVVGRYSGCPVILTQTVQLTTRRRAVRRGMLDVIPEGDESGNVQEERSMSLHPAQEQESRDRPMYSDSTGMPVAGFEKYYMDSTDMTVAGFEKYYMDSGGYVENEDEELSWFNAGVRVGVGVGLGMCLGVGIGVGLMVRTYQTTTRSLRRGLF